MAYPTLDQMGIVLNIIAGILMGLDFFIKPEWIDIINKWLDSFVVTLRNIVSIFSIKIIFFTIFFVPIVILILPMYEDSYKLPISKSIESYIY